MGLLTEILFQIQEDAVDGGYVAQAIGAGITTQAESIPELKEMIADAIRCHFDNPNDIPRIVRLHFVKDE
jgi:predicted RNase H-like HicB family nuclease